MKIFAIQSLKQINKTEIFRKKTKRCLLIWRYNLKNRFPSISSIIKYNFVYKMDNFIDIFNQEKTVHIFAA